MKDKVLTTLRELENNLENIESARKMVSTTVGAYKDVQTQVSGYSDALRTVSINIEELIRAISNLHTHLTDSALNTFQDSLNRTNTTVSEINKVAGEIEENFKSSISKSCTHFDEMTKSSIDEMEEFADLNVEELSSKVHTTVSEINKVAGAIEENFKSSISKSCTHFDEMTKSLIVEMEKSVGSNVEKLSSEVQHLEKVTCEIAPSISKQIKNIESSLKIIREEQDNNSNNLSILKQNVNEIATETANLKKTLYTIIGIGVILIIIVLLK